MPNNSNGITVVPYHPRYKKDFQELNKAWITEMFTMEPQDYVDLENFENLLDQGGQIFFALDAAPAPANEAAPAPASANEAAPAPANEVPTVHAAATGTGTAEKPGTVLACCMIAPMADDDWEIMKFAARGMASGRGAGSACLQACLDYARDRGVDRVINVSNRKCAAAIHIYRKFGFQEIPVDKEKFPFERGDIAFELQL
ncbi:Acetyltransferase (GNAT) family [Actinobaculum suis]|uniref:Acetyltransferase (GNAT) family n=1 Tax=Actinobaculum suis TaxID=1657 RepID=A0A7Z8YAD8_9ACTO|nr:GNAT family N-acetyltransferase [Actinobaculum suis]VDG76447.1 Acetyltransferase (GNAT) family [Actinobaculum suis]